MPPKFNPREKVSIHNPWPLSDYPIPHGSMVWFRTDEGALSFGKVTWYHPARQRDRGSIITPGADFYKIKVKDNEYDEVVSACHVQPKTREGKNKLARRMVWETHRNRRKATELHDQHMAALDQHKEYWQGFIKE